jgi:hypothetical protein
MPDERRTVHSAAFVTVSRIGATVSKITLTIAADCYIPLDAFGD